AGLPEVEKKLWHSHVYEVKSGSLVAPGLPDVAEYALMAKLVGTYGKTGHTWHTDQDLEVHYSVPQLEIAFTADGQADEGMLDTRDQRLGVDRAEKRRQCADIPAPQVDPGADAWQHGEAYQIPDPTGHVHHPEAAQAGGEGPDRNADSDGTGGQGGQREDSPQRER